MKAHDRYDALAGAIALGEANDGERSDFAAHARGCARCRDDARENASLVATIERARETESWRPVPSADGLVARERSGVRRTFGLLAGAVCASLAVNLALGSGFGAFAIAPRGGVAPVADDAVVSRVTIEHRPPPVRAVAAVVSGRASIASRAVARPVRVAAASRPATVRPHERTISVADLAAPATRTARADAKADDVNVPDVFAGLGLRDDSGAGVVALERPPLCANEDGRPEAVRPCRLPDGHVVR